VKTITGCGIREEHGGMRVVIEQRHSARREVVFLTLMILFGLITVAVLLVPSLVG
jgi:hypothetical protein